jgi:hypothetical protein
VDGRRLGDVAQIRAGSVRKDDVQLVWPEVGSLDGEFDRAREQSGLRLTDAVAPYARFVHAEERRWSEAQQTLGRLADRTASFLAQLTSAERKAG